MTERADNPTASIRPRSDDYAGEPYWQGVRKAPRIPGPEKLQAMHWCRRALIDRIAPATSSNAYESWIAAVEGVWWILALDDALEEHFQRIYKEARNADPNGRAVQGLRWLRNRHAHDILVTGAGGAKRNMFDPPAGSGGVLFISPSNRWKKSSDIIGDRHDKSRDIRPPYDEHVAERQLEWSLRQALRWFDLVFEATKFPDLADPKDPTILG